MQNFPIFQASRLLMSKGGLSRLSQRRHNHRLMRQHLPCQPHLSPALLSLPALQIWSMLKACLGRPYRPSVSHLHQKQRLQHNLMPNLQITAQVQQPHSQHRPPTRHPRLCRCSSMMEHNLSLPLVPWLQHLAVAFQGLQSLALLQHPALPCSPLREPLRQWTQHSLLTALRQP